MGTTKLPEWIRELRVLEAVLDGDDHARDEFEDQDMIDRLICKGWLSTVLVARTVAITTEGRNIFLINAM